MTNPPLEGQEKLKKTLKKLWKPKVYEEVSTLFIHLNMKQPVYRLIMSLMALPVGLIVGLQVMTIKNQYENNADNFESSVKNAMNEMYDTYTSWVSHTSNEEDSDTYQSLYSNEDGSFGVLIAHTVQPYPLLDFKADTILPTIRQEQFFTISAGA